MAPRVSPTEAIRARDRRAVRLRRDLLQRVGAGRPADGPAHVPTGRRGESSATSAGTVTSAEARTAPEGSATAGRSPGR